MSVAELDVLLNGFTGTRYILVLKNLAMFMISFWKKICISVFLLKKKLKNPISVDLWPIDISLGYSVSL